MEAALRGEGVGFTDNLGGSITAMLAKIQVYKPTGSDFAATQMNNAALASAGQMAAAQQLYSSSTQRIQGLQQLNRSSAAPPLASMAVIYFVFMGWRVARGDLQLVHYFTVHMAKLGFIFYLACNLTVFNKWIVSLFQLGIANAMTTAIAPSGSSTATTVNSVAGVALTAWSQAGTFDVSTRVVAFLSVLDGGIGLVLCAVVYLISRFLLAIVVILGPVAIACAMFSSTRPIFERWIGKGISLIILQVAAIITMQVVFSGDQTFMAALNPSSGTPDLPTKLWNLMSMSI
jgi:type IV secretory pathway VirB6-like protein